MDVNSGVEARASAVNKALSGPIEFERAEFSAALATVAKVAPWQRDAKSPSLIEIVVAGGIACVTSANLDLAITVAITAGTGTATMYLPLAVLSGAVQKAPTGARITLEPNGADTVFRAGRFRSVVSGRVEDFAPLRPVLDTPGDIVPATLLKAGLRATAPATLDDIKRPFLGGVYLHNGPGGLSFVAMDENRLHAAASSENRLHAAAILPEKLADLLAAVLPDDGDVRVIVGSRSVEFHTDRITISSPIIDAQFPAYQDKLRVVANGVLTAHADELLTDFDLVATVADPKLRDVRLDLGPRCEVSAFRRLGGGFDSGAVALVASYSGPPLAIGFQMRVISDALAMFGHDEIEWRMQSAFEPSIITSKSRPGIEAMVSPVRLLGEHQRVAA